LTLYCTLKNGKECIVFTDINRREALTIKETEADKYAIDDKMPSFEQKMPSSLKRQLGIKEPKS